MKCENCNQLQAISAVLGSKYYPAICRNCLRDLQLGGGFSSGAPKYERRRQYEDYAQDTVQPYNATGPNVEFYRLYPDKAENIYTPTEIEQLRRQI